MSEPDSVESEVHQELLANAYRQSLAFKLEMMTLSELRLLYTWMADEGY